MRTLIATSTLVLASNLAMADAFDYEHRLGSPDLDPNIRSVHYVAPPGGIKHSDTDISLLDFYKGNPDVQAVDNGHKGSPVISSGPELTSYDHWVKGNPDVDNSV